MSIQLAAYSLSPLGSAPSSNTPSGTTGTSSANILGYFVKINNTSLPISNYNQNNSVASIQVSNDGVYLATWAIQIQITGAPTSIQSNLAVNNVSVTSTTGSLGFANWGMTRIGGILYGTTGSIVFQTGAGNFCNVIMWVDGGSGYSTPAVVYTVTRIA